MKNQSENDFKAKFRLLNSQENSEEIIWSCSDSSDNENANQHENLGKTIQAVNRKRKRVKTRKKALKNISNLNITFIEAPEEHKSVERSVDLQKNTSSPLVTDSQHFATINNKKVLSSPILSCDGKNSRFNQLRIDKNPAQLMNSAEISANVRKKLFSNNNNLENKLTIRGNYRSTSPVLICSRINKKSRLSTSKSHNYTVSSHCKPCDNYSKHIDHEIIKSNNNDQEIKVNSENIDLIKSIQGKKQIRVQTGEENSNDAKSAKYEIIEKVKSYFDSHYSSNIIPSQQSISEYDSTPKNSSKTSEEIEIMNSQSDKKICLPQVVKLENRSSPDSLRSYDFQVETPKKIRYKKDGLAYRLSALLKKQKANTCLWQHERFLAANSNFVLPREDFTAFRIQNVIFKYGCHLLEVVDVEEKKYFVIINHLNMNNIISEQCNIFKLYRPFKIIDFNSDYQLIVNVSKFECS